MSEGRTVRVERISTTTRPVHPAGMLRFYPLGTPPSMSYFVLGDGKTTIGRAAENTISVDDEEMSRHHAVIERREDRWQIADSESANGLHLQGKRVTASTLNGGEVFRLGATFFRFLREGLAAASGEHPAHTDEIVSGPALDPVRTLLDRAAKQDLTVLVAGETGTGKELAALQLHHGGNRRSGPFVPVNCSAIPEEIVESELFGHVKGAFTGASADKLGLIRQAAGGTLFLDEIGELSMNSQAKLLRVLQDRQVRPVGGAHTVTVDVRVVCATNRDLALQVQQGEFRPDLYARLAELTVRLPTLRERIEDIPLLVQHFITKHAADKYVASVEALELLCTRSWPFNIRQLESAVRRAILLAGAGPRLMPEHFAEEEAAKGTGARANEGAPGPQISTAPSRPDNPQAARLEETLRRHAGDAQAAAAELGISRSQLYRRAKKFGIQVGVYKP